MKDIRPRLIRLFKEGYCTPQIARIARAIDEPPATIHYNIKKLEKEGAVKTYKAVFDYGKIEEGFCAFLLIALSPDSYNSPEVVANQLTRCSEVESVDVVTGEWELIAKVRTKNQEEYFKFLREVMSEKKSVQKTLSMVSLRTLKSESILM